MSEGGDVGSSSSVGTTVSQPIEASPEGQAGREAKVASPLGASLGAAVAGFGTDGIRGRVGTAVTPALALQVGYWCGLVLPAAGPVLIGTDSRSSGPMLVAALTAGLTAAGREVWQLGLCPTPAIPGTIRPFAERTSLPRPMCTSSVAPNTSTPSTCWR